ncbi:MAG: hypothetical protein A3F90_14260 [Deltaproteobacteria bacterium RIFCSPLOWO2_12_FULL_60_19]|nr:MAG: hypothetical protein A3F90_14260 [Deltaproteobacteria bacterium RIFCSPLOWO2_12_FULL_60_19]
MKKRVNAWLAGIAVLTCAATAGAAAKGAPKLRIGILIAQSGPSETQTIRGLRDGLKELRYKERDNIVIEVKDLKGERGALQPAAAELVNKKVDLIFTIGTRATQAAMAATREIPIVFRHSADPIAIGLVKNLKQPGGNVTGVAAFSPEMTGKRLETLKEIVPNLKRVHILYDSNNPFSKTSFAAAKKEATRLRLDVVEHTVKTVDELKSALGALQKMDGDAIFQVSDDLVESQADTIFEAARQQSLPTMFDGADWAPKGSMASYGANYYRMGVQAAAMIHKILRGASPKNLPVERAEKYDLLINLRMANAIGHTIPPAALKKADKVVR